MRLKNAAKMINVTKPLNISKNLGGSLADKTDPAAISIDKIQ